jgi:hypothetical protein
MVVPLVSLIALKLKLIAIDILLLEGLVIKAKISIQQTFKTSRVRGGRVRCDPGGLNRIDKY